MELIELCYATKQFSKIPQEFHPKTDKVVKLDENGNDN